MADGAKKQRRQVDEFRRPQAHAGFAVGGKWGRRKSACADEQLILAARPTGDAAELRSASTGGTSVATRDSKKKAVGRVVGASHCWGRVLLCCIATLEKIQRSVTFHVCRHRCSRATTRHRRARIHLHRATIRRRGC